MARPRKHKPPIEDTVAMKARGLSDLRATGASGSPNDSERRASVAFAKRLIDAVQRPMKARRYT